MAKTYQEFIHLPIGSELFSLLKSPSFTSYQGGISAIIDQASKQSIPVLGAVLYSAEEGDDVVVVSLRESSWIRPIVIVPRPLINRSGVFVLTPSQEAQLRILEKAGQKPGVLVTYGQSCEWVPAIETGPYHNNITGHYRRLDYYSNLVKVDEIHSPDFTSSIYKEIPHHLQYEKVFQAFITRREL